MEMSIKVRQLHFVVCACFFIYLNNGEATPTKPVSQPSYQVVLDAALACSQRQLNKYPWDPKRDHIKIAEKVRVIVDSIQLTETKRPPEPGDGIIRTFKLTYKLYATIACGEETRLFDIPNGKDIIRLPVIRHAWKKPRQLDIISDDHVVENAPSLIVYYNANDMPEIPGKAGFACIVDRKIFLEDPNAIKIDEICKGATSKEKKQTALEIERVRKLLIASPKK